LNDPARWDFGYYRIKWLENCLNPLGTFVAPQFSMGLFFKPEQEWLESTGSKPVQISNML